MLRHGARFTTYPKPKIVVSFIQFDFVVVLLLHVHGKQMWSCRYGQRLIGWCDGAG